MRFVGNNTLKLNAATVMEALQEYLDRRTVGPGADEVVSVSYVQNEFRIGLKEREEVEEKKD